MLWTATWLLVPALGTAGPRIPGTALRLGAPLASFDADSAFAKVLTEDSTVATRSGTVRFFGAEARATLRFRDDRLAEAEFSADSLSPATQDYVEDELAREGYRRRCRRWEPGARDCDWSGRTELRLEMSGAGVHAVVAGREPEAAAPAVEPAPAPKPDLSAARPADSGPSGDESTPLAAPPPVLDSCRAERPAAAREAGVFGRVIVHASVDTGGAVTGVVVYKGIPQLDAAALECARRYRFRPYVVDGRPRPFATLITVRFTR